MISLKKREFVCLDLSEQEASQEEGDKEDNQESSKRVEATTDRSESRQESEKKRELKQTEKVIQKILEEDRAELMTRRTFQSSEANTGGESSTPFETSQNDQGTLCENCHFQHDLLETQCYQYREWIKRGNGTREPMKLLEVTKPEQLLALREMIEAKQTRVSELERKYKVYIEEGEPEQVNKPAFYVFGSQSQLVKVELDLEFRTEIRCLHSQELSISYNGIRLTSKDFNELKALLARRFEGLNYSFKTDRSDWKVILHGEHKTEVANFIVEIFTKLREASYPRNWCRKFSIFEGKENVLRFKLNEKFLEYKSVSRNFRMTVPSNRLISIERIQNWMLWRKYQIEAQSLEKKLNYKSEEKLLWHGFRDIDSHAITDGEEGFDMRFSRDGRFGRGNYFAVSASYSTHHNFVHTNPDNTKQVFLARVLIGEPGANVDPNRSMPPLKAESNTRYDSVTDFEQMYVVYSNCKAYPQYLVTFED